MKKFSELNVGDEFCSECKISSGDLDIYLAFSGIKNVIYEDSEISNQWNKMISGRAILSKMEGQFTKLNEMDGNLLIFYGVDGHPTWKNRQTRFLEHLYPEEKLKMKFKISDKHDLTDEFRHLAIDVEGSQEH